MAKTNKTIEEQVIDVVLDEMATNNAHSGYIHLDDRLDGDLGMDSFDITEILVKLEIIYKVHLDADTNEVKTVADLVNLVKEAKQRKHQAI